MPSQNPPFIRNRNVYQDLEAYSSPTVMLGRIVTRHHSKYRIFIREVLGFFVFFFTTSQQHDGRKYVSIMPGDWIRRRGSHLRGNSRVEISDCCYLQKEEIRAKRKRNKIRNVGEVKQCLIDRIKTAYEEGNCIVPRKPRSGSLPIEFAFQEEGVAKNIAKNLGIF